MPERPRYTQLAIDVPDRGRYPERDWSFKVGQLELITPQQCQHNARGRHPCPAQATAVLQSTNGKRKAYCEPHLAQHRLRGK
jgi:hypothetical protein